MPRSKRYYIPGCIWHCHWGHRKDVLKFSSDRNRWLELLFKAKQRHGLDVLNYITTSNWGRLKWTDTKVDFGVKMGTIELIGKIEKKLQPTVSIAVGFLYYLALSVVSVCEKSFLAAAKWDVRLRPMLNNLKGMYIISTVCLNGSWPRK